MAEFKKASAGERGKWTEKQVEGELKYLNGKFASFCYERLPDARAARGALKASLCDFLFWWKRDTDHKVSGLLEAKETEHDYRLPKDKLGQLARMRKVRLAGGVGVVIIYHSGLSKFRIAPLEFFDGEIPPSWDLRPLPLFNSVAEAMDSMPEVFP